MAKEIMNSSLPAAIKRDLLKPEVSFATGLFEEGRERPVPAIMYMNPRDAYCTGGKCIIYLFEEAGNNIKFIGATLLEKNKLRMIDYFPNRKHQPSVTCEDFVGTVCVKMKPLDKTD